jgi:hypothetical protein
VRLGPARRGGLRFATAAGALLALDLVARLAVGEPYPGATFLLLAACGVSLLPFLPRRLATPSLWAALMPILALGSFAILLTTASLLGMRLTELSIRLSVAGLVVALAAAAAAVGSPETTSWPARREGVAIAALLGIIAVSLAASWEVVDPFPPPGSDWAYYLLYADEVEEQRHLLIDNPHAVGEGRSLGNYPGIGAVYGSLRVLDGVSSRALAYGLVLALALTPLAVYAAVAALWGVGAGLIAAAAYAVAPIHLEPLYWHGLATTLALAFIPLTLLALGLVYRGERGPRVVLFLGFSLAGVAAMHSVSAGIVALVLAIVLVTDVVLGLVRRGRRPLHAWWREGISRLVLAGCGAAVILGVGVLVHLRLQGADAGSPVSYRFFDRDWVDADTVDYYFSWRFLLLVGVGLALVLATRSLRRDAALVPLGALALAAVLVSQAWRLHVPFEYRRVVYYLAVPLVIVIGVASVRLGRRWPALAAYAVVLLAVAQVSIGLRLPERLLEDAEPRSAAVDALERFGAEIGRGDVVVADRCLGVRVPYVLRTPTLIAAEEWQVGFTKGLPAARTARAILAGGDEGRRLAAEAGVRYAVVDPACTPDAAEKLGGRPVVDAPGLVIVELT